MNHSEIIHIGCDVIDSLKICIDDLSQIKVRGRLKGLLIISRRFITEKFNS